MGDASYRYNLTSNVKLPERKQVHCSKRSQEKKYIRDPIDQILQRSVYSCYFCF